MNILFFNKKLKELAESLGENYTSDIASALDILVTAGNRISLPHSKSLGKGLFELRCLRTGLRILYVFEKNGAIILNIIIKKQDKIPKRELDLARKRQKMI